MTWPARLGLGAGLFGAGAVAGATTMVLLLDRSPREEGTRPRPRVPPSPRGEQHAR